MTSPRPLPPLPLSLTMPLPMPALRFRHLAPPAPWLRPLPEVALAVALALAAAPGTTAAQPQAPGGGAGRAATAALAASAPAGAGAGAEGASPWAVSADGTLVIDTRARLAWPRCVEGMRWSGSTCTGAPRLLSYREAQALALQRSQADGVRWRLPRVNELRRLVNRTAQPPTVDTRLFPAAPREWHWSGTATVNTGAVNPYTYGNVARGGAGEGQMAVQQGWAVDMATGEAQSQVGRATRLPVRLVRPAP